MPTDHDIMAEATETAHALGDQLRGAAAVDARIAELALIETTLRAYLVAVQTERAALASAAGKTTP